MNTYQVFTIIFSAITATSTIAAFLTCYFTYKTTRPDIKIKVERKKTTAYPQNIFVSDNKNATTLITVSLSNCSPVSGTIKECYIKYNRKLYEAQSRYIEYSSFIVQGQDLNKNPVNEERLKLLTPIEIKGCSWVEGYLIFPAFPVSCIAPFIDAKIIFRIVGQIRNYKTVVRIYASAPALSKKSN